MTQHTSKQETCLVTGAAGFFGSHLVESLVAHGYRVIGVDALLDFYSPTIKEGNIAALNHEPFFQFVKADLRHTDLDNLLADVDMYFTLQHRPECALVGLAVSPPMLSIIYSSRNACWRLQKGITYAV